MLPSLVLSPVKGEKNEGTVVDATIPISPSSDRIDGLYLGRSTAAEDEPGLFTTNSIVAGKLLGFYGGFMIENDVYEAYPSRLQRVLGKYAVSFDGIDVTVSPIDPSSPTGVDLMRHPLAFCNEPSRVQNANCAVESRIVETGTAQHAVLCMYACQQIASGEELLWKYGPHFSRDYETGDDCPSQPARLENPLGRLLDCLRRHPHQETISYELPETSSEESGSSQEYDPTASVVNHAVEVRLAALRFEPSPATDTKRDRSDELNGDDNLRLALKATEALEAAARKGELMDGMLLLNQANRALEAISSDPTEHTEYVRDALRDLHDRTFDAGSDAVRDWFEDAIVCFDVETTTPIPSHGSGKTVGSMEISVLCLQGVDGAGGDDTMTCWHKEVDGHPIELALHAFDAARVITGYNIDRFDFEVLRKHYSGDEARFQRHKSKVIDVYAHVRSATGRGFKLAELIAANPGVPEKLGDGLGAVRLWEQGQYGALERYCMRDVEAELTIARLPSIRIPPGCSIRGPLNEEASPSSQSSESTEEVAGSGFPAFEPGSPQSLVQNSPAWLGFRKGKIGASSVASFLRLDPLLDRDSAFEVLIGAESGPVETEAMRLGHQRESVIADVVSRHLGARMKETGSWPHSEHSFLFASPDRLLIDRSGEFGLLECKSVGRLAKLSDKFLLQVQMQLACVPEAKYAYIAEYDGTTCILHRMTRDSDLIKGILPYLVDVYTAALPALEGRESTDNVFSEDVKPFGRMQQNEIRGLLDETRGDRVSEAMLIRT